MKKHTLLLSSLCLLLPLSAHSEQCEENFSSSGSFLSGTTFKTWAEVPNADRAKAFDNISTFTTKNGFSIVSANASQGTISAIQSASAKNGKKIPLDILIENAGGGVKVSMLYVTPAGSLSPENAVKNHFCKTIAEAGAAGTSQSPAMAGTKKPSGAMPNMPSISEEQLGKIQKELDKKITDAKVRALVADAAPTIKDFVSRVSCLPNNTYDSSKYKSLFNIFAAPGKTLYMLSPVNQTQYHDKGSCLTVARIQGWQAPANNALKFEVVYIADDSGESAKTKHEVVKQPDGTWLFNE